MMRCHLCAGEKARYRWEAARIGMPPVEPEASVLSSDQSAKSGLYDWAALG